MYNSAEIANDATFIAGDFFDAETKELYKLWKPAKLLGGFVNSGCCLP